MARATSYVSLFLSVFFLVTQTHKLQEHVAHKTRTNQSDGIIEGHSWPTCSQQPRRMNVVDVVNKLHSRVLLTTWSTCRGKIF